MSSKRLHIKNSSIYFNYFEPEEPDSHPQADEPMTVEEILHHISIFSQEVGSSLQLSDEIRYVLIGIGDELVVSHYKNGINTYIHYHQCTGISEANLEKSCKLISMVHERYEGLEVQHPSETGSSPHVELWCLNDRHSYVIIDRYCFDLGKKAFVENLLAYDMSVNLGTMMCMNYEQLRDELGIQEMRLQYLSEDMLTLLYCLVYPSDQGTVTHFSPLGYPTHR